MDLSFPPPSVKDQSYLFDHQTKIGFPSTQTSLHQVFFLEWNLGGKKQTREGARKEGFTDGKVESKLVCPFRDV